MNNNQNQGGLLVPVLRDPLVATSLSVIPGLGQIYNLEPRKGVLFFLVGLTNIVLIGTLAWSQQLISTMKAIGTEYNITPNSDIAHALAGMHFGSAAMNVLSVLFAAFIAYAMRDAYDQARVVRRNSIYAPTAMHISEASSGSYLFHAALMVTLVIFAFFFLMPAPPQIQVTTIEFANPKIEAQKPPKVKTRARINAEAQHNPKHTRIVKNPSESNSGGRPQTVQRQAEPKSAKPSEVKPEQKSSTAKPQEAKPTPAKPAPAAQAEPAKPAEMPKPHISPVAQSTPSPTKLTPAPMQPQTPLKAVPPLPSLGQQNSPAKPLMDPTKLLAALTPQGTPTASTPLPQTHNVDVKSNGAPKLVPSTSAPGPANMPAPAIATSSSRHGVSNGPKIVETGRGERESKGTSDSTGPRPSRGAHESTGKGNDVDRFIGMSPSLPSPDKGEHNGPKQSGEPGMTPNSRKSKIMQPGSRADVNFGPYMAELQRRIKRSWFPPTDSASKRVTARFTIHQNGTLSNLQLSVPSGSSVADQAALKAISNAAPFAPLPEGSPESVDIEFKFDYNVFKGTGTLRSF